MMVLNECQIEGVMMPVTLKDVEYVANLAKLNLSREEKRRFQKELDSIIKYVGQLNGLDTQNAPLISPVVFLQNVLREDQVLPSLSQDEAWANAPEKKDGFFKVPKVIGSVVSLSNH
jgi:aspartyl-tRNA(Asn)/glutamyl-tRNA(Gln) amidotransferase subunit C